jgi:paraquat-inducible protein A
MAVVTAKALRMARCEDCQLVARLPALVAGQLATCPRCGAVLHQRKPASIARSWAWLITAFVLFIPANMLPIMTAVYFGDGEPDTILSGVLSLARSGQIPIAVLIFVASILVPFFKMVGIALLLVVVQFRWHLSLRQCTWLYRFVDLIGRWSMLDLFMISILVTLVDMGAWASVEAGPGATAFATVVVVTMFAAHAFDPRLLWDLRTSIDDGKQPWSGV